MNLLEAINEMNHLSNPSVDTLARILKDDYHIITGDKNNYGDNMLQYALFIEDGVFCIACLSDSTSENIVISPQMVALYTDDILPMLWSSMLSGKDFFIVDTIGYLHEASLNLGQFDWNTIKSQLKPGELIYLNDVYSTPHITNRADTAIYVEDNNEAPFVGMDAVKLAIETVISTKQTNNKETANFTILILPNATRAPHDKFFEWLDEKTKDIPVVTETLSKKNMAYTKPHSVLLYWSSNVFMSGIMDANGTMYRVADELDNCIMEYHKK